MHVHSAELTEAPWVSLTDSGLCDNEEHVLSMWTQHLAQESSLAGLKLLSG